MRRIFQGTIAAAITLLLLIQLVPYGRDHTNPPVSVEPAWNSPGTRALASRACFDCHSNQTTWPWYASVAPVSWLIQYDVTEGRAALNFSEWQRPREAEDLAEVLGEGEMPPALYVALHPSARLSQAETAALEAGLAAIAGPSGGEQDDDH